MDENQGGDVISGIKNTRKSDLFMLETSKMVEKSYQLIQQRKTQTYAYITVTDPEYIRPMFEVT